MTDKPTLETVLELIDALRSENGCPWDRKQTPDSMMIYLIEEVFELAEAIAVDDIDAVEEELGDVFFQLLFLYYLFQKQRHLTLGKILARNIQKMIRRHPHVFGDDQAEDAGQVKKRWREIKQQEKGATTSLMDSVPSGLPALMRAYRISERAAGTGFDWNTLEAVIRQAEAEWDEFKTEIARAAQDAASHKTRVELEFGDVLFTLVNVARLAGIHPETALGRSTAKFINRFRYMEHQAAERRQALERIDRDEMELMWQTAKREKG